MRSLIIIIIALVAGIFCFIMEKKNTKCDESSAFKHQNEQWRFATSCCFFMAFIAGIIFLAQLFT